MNEEDKEILKGADAKRYITLERIFTRLVTYVKEGKETAPAGAGVALREQNMPMFAYYEASIHLLDDIEDILEGKYIETMKEAQANREKHYNENRTKEAVADPSIH